MQATDVSSILVPGARIPWGYLHHWYSAGKGRPASAPGLLAQLSVRYTDGRHVTIGTDRTWKQLKAEWLPAAERNTDAGDFVEIIDGRAPHSDGRSPLSTTAPGRPPLCSDLSGQSPSPSSSSSGHA